MRDQQAKLHTQSRTGGFGKICAWCLIGVAGAILLLIPASFFVWIDVGFPLPGAASGDLSCVSDVLTLLIVEKNWDSSRPRFGFTEMSVARLRAMFSGGGARERMLRPRSFELNTINVRSRYMATVVRIPLWSLSLLAMAWPVFFFGRRRAAARWGFEMQA